MSNVIHFVLVATLINLEPMNVDLDQLGAYEHRDLILDPCVSNLINLGPMSVGLDL